MTDRALKPCPFCGNVENLEIIKDQRYAVRCRICYADGPYADMTSKKKAIEAWNTRPDPAPKPCVEGIARIVFKVVCPEKDYDSVNNVAKTTCVCVAKDIHKELSNFQFKPAQSVEVEWPEELDCLGEESRIDIGDAEMILDKPDEIILWNVAIRKCKAAYNKARGL